MNPQREAYQKYSFLLFLMVEQSPARWWGPGFCLCLTIHPQQNTCREIVIRVGIGIAIVVVVFVFVEGDNRLAIPIQPNQKKQLIRWYISTKNSVLYIVQRIDRSLTLYLSGVGRVKNSAGVILAGCSR